MVRGKSFLRLWFSNTPSSSTWYSGARGQAPGVKESHRSPCHVLLSFNDGIAMLFSARFCTDPKWSILSHHKITVVAVIVTNNILIVFLKHDDIAHGAL